MCFIDRRFCVISKRIYIFSRIVVVRYNVRDSGIEYIYIHFLVKPKESDLRIKYEKLLFIIVLLVNVI